MRQVKNLCVQNKGKKEPEAFRNWEWAGLAGKWGAGGLWRALFIANREQGGHMWPVWEQTLAETPWAELHLVGSRRMFGPRPSGISKPQVRRKWT